MRRVIEHRAECCMNAREIFFPPTTNALNMAFGNGSSIVCPLACNRSVLDDCTISGIR